MCSCINIELGTYGNQVLIKVPDNIELLLNSNYSIRRRYLGVDACISKEVEELLKKGIRTTGCCCGHNIMNGYIGVFHEDIPKMIELGYKTIIRKDYPERLDSFHPKTKGA